MGWCGDPPQMEDSSLSGWMASRFPWLYFEDIESYERVARLSIGIGSHQQCRSSCLVAIKNISKVQKCTRGVMRWSMLADWRAAWLGTRSSFITEWFNLSISLHCLDPAVRAKLALHPTIHDASGLQIEAHWEGKKWRKTKKNKKSLITQPQQYIRVSNGSCFRLSHAIVKWRYRYGAVSAWSSSAPVGWRFGWLRIRISFTTERFALYIRLHRLHAAGRAGRESHHTA